MLFKLSSKFKFKVQACGSSPHVETLLKRLLLTHEDNTCVPIRPKCWKHSDEGSYMTHTDSISSVSNSKVSF
jgi:hypothetical protein